ncbi:hypothetical protein FOI67_05590 [Geobacillus sp. LEMMJ02]|uniref:Integrase n=1 Tax=Bacillus caldolyticus TaxID=1394 RepID=A0ABN5FZ27_BACCL|nr:hypothetical protein CWI35_17265 [[Bacillus] caldolyticus]OQP12295.1 hypothetical protein B1692_12720 [Geobacillus thermoleovorans]QCK83362.1 hypothetical protein E5Z46_14900 [Geobacillus kaustophilus NBRC 102445]TRY44007.1 hypothetical protein FOI67_05590 [Geobacillus sp. LEMMJ02]
MKTREEKLALSAFPLFLVKGSRTVWYNRHGTSCGSAKRSPVRQLTEKEKRKHDDQNRRFDPA